MNLQILTPEKTIYEGEVEMVRVPGTKGLFQILNNHAPIISTLEKGKVKIRENSGNVLEYDIVEGYIKSLNNKITIIIQK